jgi:hypothetical protein
VIKPRRIRRTENVACTEEKVNACMILVGTPEEKSPLEKPRSM